MNFEGSDFFFSEVNDIHILRDDLFEGGTKARVLLQMLSLIDSKGVVYPAHPYGYGAEALAIACNKHKKELILLYPPYSGYPNDMMMPRPMRRATVRPRVSYHIIEDELEQGKLVSRSQRLAETNNYYFMQIGFSDTLFISGLKLMIKAVPNIESFPEIWVTAGSGLLARTLNEVLPNSKIIALDLGMKHCDTLGIQTFKCTQKVEEQAVVIPSFPSARYYDAKLWDLMTRKAKKGALMWNVAG